MVLSLDRLCTGVWAYVIIVDGPEPLRQRLRDFGRWYAADITAQPGMWWQLNSVVVFWLCAAGTRKESW